MGTAMLPYDAQLAIEHAYSRNKINGYIRNEIKSSTDINKAIDTGVTLLTAWLDKKYYESKQERLDQIRSMDLQELVFEITVSLSYHVKETLIVNVAAQAAKHLNMSDAAPAILTVTEIIAVLAEVDLWDIYRAGKNNSIYLKSNINFDKKLTEFINNSKYLPPMVCKPEKVKSNKNSGYLTFDESVILKKNHHTDPISLDVINLQNQIPLSIDTDFMAKVKEVPNKPFKSVETQRAWVDHIEGSNYFYALMLQQGNKFYFDHRYDKRGRLYSKGYWINYQGTAYKKAMLSFNKKETIDVPEEYKSWNH